MQVRVEFSKFIILQNSKLWPRVRTEDLPEARNLGIEKTFVAVFTDGASNSEERDNFYNEIDLLKKQATILSIGLGSS